MNCYIVSPKEASEHTFNSQIVELLGANIKIVPVNEVHDTIEAEIDNLRNKGKKPFLIYGNDGILERYKKSKCSFLHTGGTPLFFDWLKRKK